MPEERLTCEFIYTDPRSHRKSGMPASFAGVIRQAYEE